MMLAAFAGTVINATDLTVKPGEYAIEKALQQAREERRLNNAKDICIRDRKSVV